MRFVGFLAKTEAAKNVCCHAAEASAERRISLSPPNMSKQIRSLLRRVFPVRRAHPITRLFRFEPVRTAR